MEQVSLGTKIAKARINKGFSQEKVAELVGVSRQAVTKWECDQSRPGSDNLIALAKLLEVSVDELLGNDHNERNYDTEVRTGDGTDASEARKVNGTDAAEAVGEVGKDRRGRLPWIFFLISCVCMVAYPIISAVLDRFYAGTMIVIFILVIPCQLFIHAVFSSAAKSGNFSMIAGYDPKMSYNVEEYKRVLGLIDLSIGCTTSVYVFLYCVLGCVGVGGEWTGEILLFLYVVQLTGDLLLINLKNADKLYTNEDDAKRVKASLPIDLIFLLLMLFNCAALAVGIAKRNAGDSEATVGALCCAMFIGVMASIVGLFVEEKRIKKWSPAEKSYRPGVFGIICMIICILMTLLLVLGA